MASPARVARLAAQASGFTEIVERGRGYLKTRNPATGQYCLDAQAGGVGWHYGMAFDQEIDTAWEIDTGAWQYKMVKAGYNLHARDVLNVGDIINYADPVTGENITFQPLGLNWVDNATDSRQQIAIAQAVTAQVADDILYFPDGYGTGRHFRYQADITKLIKQIIIDSATDLPTPTVSNPYLEIEFIITKSPGVTEWIDGVQWDRSTRVVTANQIEYRTPGGTILWVFDYPRAIDSDRNEIIGQFQLRRQGANRYCTVRIPKSWIDTAVFPIILDPTIDTAVGASGDDARWKNWGVWSNTDSTVNFGGEGAGDNNAWRIAARFTGLTFNGTINVSYLSFKAFGAYSSGGTENIWAEDADNPGQITAYDDGEARAKTTATTGWSLPATVADTWYNSPSISSILQELVDSYTISADAMQLILIWDGSVEHYYYLYTYDSGGANAPKLHIEYTTGGAFTVNVSQSVALSENNTPTVSSPQINVNQTVSVSESIGKLIVSAVNISDGASLTENATITINTSVTISDALGLVESIGLTIGPPQVSVFDSISISENTNVIIESGLPDLNVAITLDDIFYQVHSIRIVG